MRKLKKRDEKYWHPSFCLVFGALFGEKRSWLMVLETNAGNRCLGLGAETPPYMSYVEPGSLMQLITAPYMPPAEAPNPILTLEDVAEPPLPPVSPPGPASNPNSSAAAGPTSRNAQPKIAASYLLLNLAMLLSALLLLWNHTGLALIWSFSAFVFSVSLLDIRLVWRFLLLRYTANQFFLSQCLWFFSCLCCSYVHSSSKCNLGI